ncbi:MAG: hypothetical protein MH321_02250 [Leptospiraceae bacterium]|nr:hypothetical protein [Leptospiraceae bacterium]
MNKNLTIALITINLIIASMNCNQDIVISTEPVLDLVKDSDNSVNQANPSATNSNQTNTLNGPGASSSGAVGSAPGGATGTTTFGATGSPPGNPLGF